MNATDELRDQVEVHLRSRPAQLAEGTAQHDDRHDGGAPYQFVARHAGAADTLAMHVRAQATFPLMRSQDLSD